MTTIPAERLNWRLLLIAWAVLVAVLYLPAVLHHTGTMPFTDNDDSMRLVTATDLADGQAWQDKIEHRDDAPIGMPLHWSRLVDAPISALIVATRPFLGANAGEVVSLFWPPLLLLPLLLISIGFTRRMLGPGHQTGAIVLPLLSVVLLGEFAPGRIDHHNIQILLTSGLVWATVSGRTSGWAAIAAGLLAATSIAIGIETLPFIVAAVLAFALFWVRDPAAAGNTRRFALAFAFGSLAHFLAATSPHLYFVSACDELSDTYVVAAFLAGGALILSTLLGGHLTPARRLILVGLLGVLAGAIVLVLFPECRGGPYGRLDARAFELLLAHNTEAQPLSSWFVDDQITSLTLVSAPFIGLAVLVAACFYSKGEERIDWLVTLLYLSLAVIVMIMQVRGIRLAVMPAIPAAVWLVDRTRAAYADRRGLRQAGAMVGSWVLFAGLAQFLVSTVAMAVFETSPAAAATGGKPVSAVSCLNEENYTTLATLPAGVTIGPPTLGPRVLRYTPDSVVSAGYHRNIDGTFAVDDFLNAGEAAAKAVAINRDVRYVLACPGLMQLAETSYSKPDSFVVLWASGRHWDWLTPVSKPGDLITIYRVDLPK